MIAPVAPRRDALLRRAQVDRRRDRDSGAQVRETAALRQILEQDVRTHRVADGGDAIGRQRAAHAADDGGQIVAPAGMIESLAARLGPAPRQFMRRTG